MKHDDGNVQRVAMFWHLAFCLLNVGALIYHGIAAVEHKSEYQREKDNASRR